jgi:hypothetical protein
MKLKFLLTALAPGPMTSIGREGVIPVTASGARPSTIRQRPTLSRNDAEERFISGVGAGFMRSKRQLHGNWVGR